MRVCVDLDGTLCEGRPYEIAEPVAGASEFLRTLKAAGHTIVIHTARGMGSSAGSTGIAVAKIGALTLSQLDEWGFVYDEVLFGKPAADIYIDDKSIASFRNFHDYQSFTDNCRIQGPAA